MKILEQSYQIICTNNLEDELREQCKIIEYAGRIAYKSEDKITSDSWKAFCKMIIDKGHEAVIEFGHMTVKFITDRGITHELVRHRLCSFFQESTRYCNYSKDKFGNEVTFIIPCGVENGATKDVDWQGACQVAEQNYLNMLEKGFSPQIARSILPNCTKSEIMVKANFREWRHIFRLRAVSKAAHPDMRRLMIPLYEECRKFCPIIFEMGDVE